MPYPLKEDVSMHRRNLLLGGLAGLSGLAAASPAHAAGPAGMPTYRYLRDALRMPLNYNPTGEFIFPCIRGVYDKISGARGRYYLYYAPHEKPGGICVAWANSLDGPFTEHTANPVIDNVLPSTTVSHVSSPHVTWDAASRQFFLYFHGENTTTRVARSSDGLTFRDETPILSTRLVPGLSETSYARVFAHGGRYVMVYMGVQAGRRRIYHGFSPNGWDQWTFAQTPLVNPEPDGLTDISGPSLVVRNGTVYVAYHGNDGRMRITEVGNGFDLENHLGVFYSPVASDNGRAAAPSFGTDGGVQYMFYEAGPRLSARICIARAV
ncbi:hypothetical protein AB0M02_22510 [Actinoplanes sp. NPDC051861]|uniref:hypothetical protein n=1 Tax=Actinoplanes sp. NPDC051861 TaxID=3155170 RepID=UPI0034152781